MKQSNIDNLPLQTRLNIESRVKHILRLFTKQYEGHDRMAAQYLFSALFHLERIAIIAAERGDGIKGQLEDEWVHHLVFGELAGQHGGIVSADPQTEKLIKYLESLEGEDSLAALNVVAESWLDTVFDHLGKCGIAPAVFAMIEEDEHRHVYDALSMARPDPDAFIEVVRNLEKMLMDISYTPEFMFPIIWLIGQTNVCNMGLAICDAHERACDHMGIVPDLNDMRLSARALRILERTSPQPVEMNEWERTKAETWTSAAPQHCYIDIVVKETNPVKLQAQVISCLGKIFVRYPRLRNVIRRNQLYRTNPSVIGMRALYDDERVMTLWIGRPHRYNWKQIVRKLAHQNRKIKSEPYEPYEGLVSLNHDLLELYPPHRSCCVVSYNGASGGLYGTGPLSDTEGVPMLVTLGRPHKKYVEIGGEPVWSTVVTTCISADHRTVDGRDIGIMANELIKEMARL